MTAPDLALAETDPAGFVLAVADLREELIRGPHLPPEIAAWHAAEVALWRGVAERHRMVEAQFPPTCDRCGPVVEYDDDFESQTYLVIWPCDDLLAVVAAAKAYLAGAA